MERMFFITHIIQLLSLLHLVLLIIGIYKLIQSKTQSSDKLLWLILMIIFPVVGSILCINKMKETKELEHK